MNPSPRHPAFSLPLDEGAHRALGGLRAVGGLIWLALIVLLTVAAGGLLVRLYWPVGGELKPVVLAGAAALAALAGGSAALEVSSRRAKKVQGLTAAAGAYKLGCTLAGCLNLLAGCATTFVIFANGLTNGLWVPVLLVLAVNVLGMVLAVPRLKHLRALHYRPTLPYTRM